MGRRRQEADVRRMPAIHIRMRYTAENGELIPVFLEQLVAEHAVEPIEEHEGKQSDAGPGEAAA